MDKYPLIRKCFTLGIILLFIGLTHTPNINANKPISDHIINATCKSNITLNNGTLSGHVTDSKENPIEGAIVRVYFHETYSENYSDSTGYFHVTNISICNCTKNATCSKEGYYSTWVYLGIWENTTYDFVLTSKGDWLYVGGSGPGNYTRIQDAIDNASDGDTVFVFDDSSPYKGVVLVSKSVTIQGENKNTTIIDYGGFNISVSNVTITGFTIQNSETGVYIIGYKQPTCHNTVNNNIFLNVSIGVNVYMDDWPYDNPNSTKYGYNVISNNVIIYTKTLGITVLYGHDNIVIGNDVSQDDKYHDPNNSGLGIGIEGSFNNISYNNVHDNGIGIELGGFRNEVYRNTVKENYQWGLFVANSSYGRVIQNNFINNQRDVRIWMFGVPLSYVLQLTFDGNYWDRARILPHPIGGFYCFFIDSISMLLGEIFGEFALKIVNMLLEYYSNFVRFDWHPAQEPYNIPQFA
jgi:parallel beta-helix repeat protein